MSDCLIDFRPPDRQREDFAARWLRFFPDIEAQVFEEKGFSLVLARSDNTSLWGAYRDPVAGLLVALVGRIAMEESEWAEAAAVTGEGGVACKAIALRYRQRGVAGLRQLNGNFLVIVHDPAVRKVYLVTDRCGMVPLFRSSTAGGGLVYGTHPDLLAAVTGGGSALDSTSLAEFIVTGKVSFPYTYYRTIAAVDFGAIHGVDVSREAAVEGPPDRYFRLEFRPEPSRDEWPLAERLAEAFKNSVRRRTLPRLGRTALALSGGLDSRMILSACPTGVSPSAFCFFDAENLEFRTARAIAEANGVSFTPVPRDPEHYGNAAEVGVRIYGGMGSLAGNHFLGFRDRIVGGGVGNLLTGCYCDYFFKGLAQNRRIHPITRRERPGPFQQEYYRPFFPLRSEAGVRVRERLDEVFPAALRQADDEQSLLALEARRLFPLSYEGDCPQRLVPQRVMPWYLPVVDNDVVDVYLSMPVRARFNASLFSKMVERVCGPRVCRIPDSNTGAPVNASEPRRLFHVYLGALRNRVDRHLRPRLATSGSWPNWEHYVHHSPVLRRLWTRPHSGAVDVLRAVLGYDPTTRPIESYAGHEVELFVRLLTVKLWVEGNGR